MAKVKYYAKENSSIGTHSFYADRSPTARSRLTFELSRQTGLRRKPKGKKISSMINKGLFTSNTDLWATPQEFFDRLNEEFHFTLDPCANDENHKCPTYFTKEQDGLKQDWQGHRVFCNPPYGRAIGAWVKKCHDEAQKGALVVMLIPARTDTSYFHDYIYHKAELRFIRGRLKFGNAEQGAPFPSMVVVFNQPPAL